MSIELYLHKLTEHIGHLLDHVDVNLFLGCPDSTLRHPLLKRFPSLNTRYSIYRKSEPGKNSDTQLAFFSLYDIVVQSGLIWGVEEDQGEEGLRSTIVAPLEATQGVLGLLVCIDRQPLAALYGECFLLKQYLPTIVQQIEQVLRVTPSQEKNDDLIREGERQGNFLSFMAHELRRPLTAIKGYAGLLHAYGSFSALGKEEEPARDMTAARQQRYLTAIMEQTNLLEVLITDLLNGSRTQAGRLTLRCTRMDVGEVCNRALRIMQDRVARCSPERYCLQSRLDPHLPQVYADPHRVEQIVTNLLENAINYSPNGGLIEILVTRYPPPVFSDSRADPQVLQERQVLYITVRDQGIGIPLSEQCLLFQPFSRLKHPVAQQVEGSGLGLYISRKLVEAMGGCIVLWSREGEGTSVTFTLPIFCIRETDNFSAFSQERFCIKRDRPL
jgi:signal transduction histidine kinase